MKKEDEIEVRISHPNGLKMRFSESVTKFLIQLPEKRVPFRALQWVRTLSDDVITQLGKLAETFLHDGADVYLDDVVQASILMVAGETGKQNVTVSPDLIYEWMAALRYITALERMKRSGLVILNDEIGITTMRNATVTLTDRGMQAGLDLRSNMN
jgi:hypothetical protein